MRHRSRSARDVERAERHACGVRQSVGNRSRAREGSVRSTVHRHGAEARISLCHGTRHVGDVGVASDGEGIKGVGAAREFHVTGNRRGTHRHFGAGSGELVKRIGTGRGHDSAAGNGGIAAGDARSGQAAARHRQIARRDVLSGRGSVRQRCRSVGSEVAADRELRSGSRDRAGGIVAGRGKAAARDIGQAFDISRTEIQGRIVCIKRGNRRSTRHGDRSVRTREVACGKGVGRERAARCRGCAVDRKLPKADSRGVARQRGNRACARAGELCAIGGRHVTGLHECRIKCAARNRQGRIGRKGRGVKVGVGQRRGASHTYSAFNVDRGVGTGENPRAKTVSGKGAVRHIGLARHRHVAKGERCAVGIKRSDTACAAARHLSAVVGNHVAGFDQSGVKRAAGNRQIAFGSEAFGIKVGAGQHRVARRRNGTGNVDRRIGRCNLTGGQLVSRKRAVRDVG